MAISDFVLLHNKAAEGLVKPNRVGYDIYSDIADVKELFLKYCKHYEKRLSSMVPTIRVVPAGDGEAPTTVSILGFVVDARVKKKTFAPNIDMQFIERQKNLYLELHRDLSKAEYRRTSRRCGR